MPVYEYVCTVCGHPVEVMHSYTATGPTSCERCGSPMRKALSTPAIVFKGSGWAKKDHRDKVHASTKPSATPAVTAEGGMSAAASTSPADGGSAASATASDSADTGASTASAAAPAAASPNTPTSATPSTSSAASSG